MSVDFIAQSTLLFFATSNTDNIDVDQRRHVDADKIVDNILDVQRRSTTFDRRSFDPLERFYADVFDADVSRASDYVDVWVALGVTFECLSSLMNSAVIFRVAFDMVSLFKLIFFSFQFKLPPFMWGLGDES